MAELNLKQIIDRLNSEFTGETRKLVFWYDDKADFAEDIESVELENKGSVRRNSRYHGLWLRGCNKYLHGHRIEGTSVTGRHGGGF